MLDTFERSLIQSRNNRGPRIKPCGTLHLSVVKSDETFFISVH